MNNQTIKDLQLLKQAKHRKNQNRYIAEGKRLIETALDWSSSVESIFCTEKFYVKNKNNWRGFVGVDNLMINILTESQFKKISSTSTPSGIAAKCSIIEQSTPNLNQSHWIYLDRISDPGNLGTILRTASWFGIDNIALSPESVDPYNPKTIRAGMGAHFSLNIHRDIKLGQFVKTHSIIAGSKEGDDVSKFKFPDKYVLVLGNEAHGISRETEEIVQHQITIKKIGQCESLNLASAASVIMYVITKDQ